MISYSKQFIDKSDVDYVKRSLDKDFITQGPLIEKFEKKLCKFFKSNYCIAVSSGTAGLHLSGMALGWNKDDLILLSANTFVATANAAIYSKAKINLIDIDPETNNIDAKNSNVIRFKVIRNTEYGDRYKLFTFKLDGNEIINLPKYLGFALRKVENGYLIDALEYNGLAKKKGLDFDDRLTSIEYQNPDQLNKYWAYIFGLVVLLILLMEQFRRRRIKN